MEEVNSKWGAKSLVLYKSGGGGGGGGGRGGHIAFLASFCIISLLLPYL